MLLNRRQAAMALVAVLALPLGSCGGRSVASGVSLGPRLTPARLGSLRSSMTYDGDWLGGMPPREDLAEDLELACRRGVEIVVDLRSVRSRLDIDLELAVTEAGLEYASVELNHWDGGEAGRERGEYIDEASNAAVDRVRGILRAPGRRRVLLIDDDGTLCSMIYAIHLSADEGVAEWQALRAARSTGISRTNEEFVKRQVQRIRGGE